MARTVSDSERSPDDWADLTARFRALAMRALESPDDRFATAELIEILKPRLIGFSRFFPRQDRPDLLQTLNEVAWAVVKQYAFDRSVHDLLAYTFAAVRREFGRQITKQNDGWPLMAAEPREQAHPRSEEAFDDVVHRMSLQSFKKEMTRDGRPVDILVAQVVETVYLLDLNITEACSTLKLTTRERNLVRQTISRQRATPGSPLRRFASWLWERLDDGSHLTSDLPPDERAE